jgi:hypothetical protein
MWKDVGYFSITKKGIGANVVIKHARYYVKLEEIREVLEGKKEFCLIYEAPALARAVSR